MAASFTAALSLIGREAVRVVLPSWCVVCEKQLPWRDRVAACCGGCWAGLPRITTVKCRSCGLPLAGTGELKCLACQADPLPLDWCDAWGHYRGGLERVLQAFKFARHDFFDRPLAELLAETLRARNDVAFDALVPVPMSRRKERARGYNQAELIARALSESTGIRCDHSLLVKVADRARQSTLPRSERAANVRRAFAASPRAEGRAVLIVDDISTTGHTLRACARELVRAGAERVSAIAVAKVT